MEKNMADISSSPNVDRYKNNKHYKSFSKNYLNKDEKVMDVLEGYIGNFAGKDDDEQHNGLLFCTNKTISFHRKGLIKHVSRSIPLKKVSSIDFDKGFMSSKIVFHTSNDSIVFKSFENLNLLKNFKLLAEKIRDQGEISSKNMPTISDDPIEKIKKLSQLKDDGIITKEEFEEKKKILLKEL